MAFVLNEYDVDDAVRRYAHDDRFPVLGAAVRTLDNLVGWTNTHSDGWPYWSKPSTASTRLQRLIHDVDRFDPQDVTPAAYLATLPPIKAFRTRHAADFTIEGI